MPQPRPQHSAQLWTDPGAFATSLVALVIDRYGTEAFRWDPLTLAMEIEDDWRIDLPRGNYDRLMAGIQILTTDDFYRNLPDFNVLCNVLAGDSYDPQLPEIADPLEVAWGITEGLLLAPPDDDDETPFSPEICAFIGKLLDAHGIIHPPDVLQIAIRDEDLAGRVRADFSDDPAMFTAIYQVEADKTAEINAAVRRTMHELIAQVSTLQLSEGDARGAFRHLLSA